VKINRNNIRAFTLIELILAIGVAAIALAAANAVFFAALHLRDRTENVVDEAAPVDQALAFLRRDLQCAVTPKADGVLSGDFKVGDVTSVGIDGTVAIEFFTATGALHENEPWGDIQRVTYELKDTDVRNAPGKVLVRSVTRNLLSATTPDVEDQWMMSGVQRVEFLCFDGARWFDTWDTTDTASVNTNLPVAVRVRIQVTSNEGAASPRQPIEILVPIDSRSRTNQVITGS
jgi:type II secretion system protein J